MTYKYWNFYCRRKKVIVINLIFTIALLSIYPDSYCQNIKDFPGYVKSMGMTYKAPSSFIETQVDNSYRPGNDMVISAFFYELSSQKSDILITISILDLTHINDSISRIVSPRNAYGKNLDFLRGIQIESDVSRDQLIFISNKETEKFYNADNAAIYKFRNNRSYKGNKFCKVVLIHKKDRADIQLYYWYNDNSKDLVDAIMEQTRTMLRFN